MSEAIPSDRPKLRRREGDAERLRDYATATQRAQPAGFRCSASGATASRRQRAAPSCRPPPAQVAPIIRASPSARPTAPPQVRQAGARLPAKALGLSGACRGRGRPAAEKPSRPPRARHPGWPGPATSKASPPGGRLLPGAGRKLKGRRYHQGTLSREGEQPLRRWRPTGCARPWRSALPLASRLGSPD